jgi:hypothetical protein
LQLEKNQLANLAEKSVADGKPVKLMAVNSQMALAAVIPRILLINRHAHQVRHDFG